jgi:thiamine kinase-like enzyme
LWSDPQKKISIIAKMMGKSQPFNNKNKTQVIQFLIDLDRHFQNSEVSFEWGNDARQKLSDYSQLIEKRISQIALGCLENRYLDKIAHLLETQVLPLKNILIQDFNYQITKLNWNTESHFSKKQLTFSPSDFGSHNALTDDKNQLSFIDFEYAGADDPAKLFADFFSHVADQTPLSVKQDIFVSYAEHKQTLDPTFLTRFTLVKPLIQLEWVLIVLNIAAPENLKRRLFSNPSLSVEELINNRWQTATEMIKRF